MAVLLRLSTQLQVASVEGWKRESCSLQGDWEFQHFPLAVNP